MSFLRQNTMRQKQKRMSKNFREDLWQHGQFITDLCVLLFRRHGVADHEGLACSVDCSGAYNNNEKSFERNKKMRLSIKILCSPFFNAAEVFVLVVKLGLDAE